MDNIDKIIINLLQDNARQPLKFLASKVFLSSPAVSARIDKLEKEGIITGYHAEVDPILLGYHVMAFINMSLDPKQKPQFYPYISDCPNVLECNCVTGTYSMLIKVAFPNTMELDTFVSELQKFGKTETQIVFSTPVKARGVKIN
ncbi:MAG: Lrp/AsnC family transcriptional regulator [Lachnospiraceae bacterium]|nr:Lrp/AsnC family transcriptional regulator [Lachnospiraceae bacterium]